MMGKVTYNQSGYIGSSMSARAAAAYEDGEMPKSKWTKAAMLAAIEGYCYEFDICMTEDVSKLRKAELFERFFYCSSWHHTGKFANETDFYGIDEEAIVSASRPLSADEIAARDAAIEAAKKAETERLEAARRERERFIEEHRGLNEHGATTAMLFQRYPELVCTGEYRKSRSGKTLIFKTAFDGVEIAIQKRVLDGECAFGGANLIGRTLEFGEVLAKIDEIEKEER